MLTEEFKKNFANWFRTNSKNRKNLKDITVEMICKHSREKRPAEQIAGMVTLLDDFLHLEDDYLK